MYNINRTSCGAHTLQLVIGKSLVVCDVFLARAKRLINFFLSPKQTELLENAQKEVAANDDDDIAKTNNKYLHAIGDVPTRWNSSFLAWERIYLLKDAIYAALDILSKNRKNNLQIRKDYNRLNKILLEEDEWDFMLEMINILGPFYKSTLMLGASNYVTISLMYPVIEALKEKFKVETNYNEYCDEPILESSETVFDEIEKIYLEMCPEQSPTADTNQSTTDSRIKSKKVYQPSLMKTIYVIGNPPNISVPTHFYKVILAIKNKNQKDIDLNIDKDSRDNDDKIYALATFVLPNENIPSSTPISNFSVPLDALERTTGLTFFENLVNILPTRQIMMIRNNEFYK
ncbi:7692_t:CDS:2 [Entrophospora sp. SA101]|nr:7692_t:CDS:2 [Entrophospora sp. SA101]